MSNDVEHKKRMRRFRKAQKIFDLPDDQFPYAVAEMDRRRDPHLLEDYAKYLDSLVDVSNPGAMKYLDYYRFKAELDSKHDDDVIEYLSYGEPNFAPYDNAKFDFEDRVNAFALTGEFQEWRNRYFVLEGFVYLVRAKISPPAWMLEALAQGFSKHLRDPDPRKLAKQLGLQGSASGKTNPYDEFRRLVERRAAITEMLTLISEFEISRMDAARAVIIRRKLSVSEKTLCNNCREYEKDNADVLPHVDFSLGSVERQKYVERYPPSARRLLTKKLPQ